MTTFVPPARHLLRAKDLADARYFERLGVDDLARAAGLSRAHFSREFRAAFGESPHSYLLTRRMERAAALLRTTDHSVADICLSVGLQSVGSFTTSFKRTYGVTPTAYRARFPSAAAQRPGAGLRGPLFRPSATQHVWRRHRLRARLASSHDENLKRTAMGSRPGRGARLLHREARHGGSLRRDAPEMGDFRWLTVGPPGQEDISIVLMAIPGAPVMDDRPPTRSAT